MSHRTPHWWYDGSRAIPLLLSPLSLFYGMAVRYRWMTTKPHVSKLPVICVGNFTMGGAGKTPTALYIAKLLDEMEEVPAFLTRGYGGRTKGPHLVDAVNDLSVDVGDEPLLLASSAPTVVCADRPRGSGFIEEDITEPSPTVIVMDDGYQNPSLRKSLSILVVDGERGTGNGHMFPAGPLREPMRRQKRRMDVMITIGEQISPVSADPSTCNISGRLVTNVDRKLWEGQPVIAYTGIARPEKFYKTLSELGAKIENTFDFPDHHQFVEEDVTHLLNEAYLSSALLVTTEKDIVRLDSTKSPFSELKKRSRVIPVRLEVSQEDEEQLKHTLKSVLTP